MQGLRKNAYNYPLYKIVHEVTSFSKKPIFQLGNFEKAFINEIVIDTVLYEQKTKHKQNHKLESSKVFPESFNSHLCSSNNAPKTLGDNALYELQLN